MFRNITILTVNRLIVFLLLACLIACSPSSPSNDGSTGNVARGEALYRQTHIGDSHVSGCITCHAIEPDLVIVGPSLADIGTRADVRANEIGGMTAADYLHQSIINPNAYIVDQFEPNMMFSYYSEQLTPQEIDDLVAFLLAQKE